MSVDSPEEMAVMRRGDPLRQRWAGARARSVPPWSPGFAVAALVRDGPCCWCTAIHLRQWYPDCWDLVGGHVEPGESPHQAVSRECLEELGVHVHDPLPIPMTVSDPTLDVHAFLVTRWEGSPSTPLPRSTTIFAGSGPRSRGPDAGPPGQPVEHPARRSSHDRLAATKPLRTSRTRDAWPLCWALRRAGLLPSTVQRRSALGLTSSQPGGPAYGLDAGQPEMPACRLPPWRAGRSRRPGCRRT